MKIISIIIAVIALLGGYMFLTYTPLKQEVPMPIVEPENTTTNVSLSTPAPSQIALFSNETYDFSFKYRIKPYGYSNFENSNQMNTEQGAVFGVTLIRSNDYNELERAKAEGQAHDGPPTISIAVYDAMEVTDITQWLEDNKMFTNCELGGVLSTTLAGKDASSCLWDGLYKGVTVAQLHNDRIYMLTGTREDNDTQNGFSYQKDFEDIVATFTVTQ